jgi:hypothetical protein
LGGHPTDPGTVKRVFNLLYVETGAFFRPRNKKMTDAATSKLFKDETTPPLPPELAQRLSFLELEMRRIANRLVHDHGITIPGICIKKQSRSSQEVENLKTIGARLGINESRVAPLSTSENSFRVKDGPDGSRSSLFVTQLPIIRRYLALSQPWEYCRFGCW